MNLKNISKRDALKFIKNNLTLVILAACMLLTGTINTISTKFQDEQAVKGLSKQPPQPFEHAFFQTLVMFIGEFSCLVVFGISKYGSRIRNRIFKKPVVEKRKSTKPKSNPILMGIPAALDLLGTTLLNFSLLYTYASVYQMLRGTVVVMNAIMSIIFLKSKLYVYHWIGIILIMIGLITVGTSSIVYGSSHQSASNPMLGNVMVVIACIFAAAQFVIEEKIMEYSTAEPLEFVGWEGYWGFSFTIVALFILYFIPGNDDGKFESAPNAIYQTFTDIRLFIAVAGSALSIAFFNFFGLSITKYASSTTRATIDACRTMFVWIVSMILGWEHFRFLQLGGFSVLVTGTFIYNDILHVPYFSGHAKRQKYRQKVKDQSTKINDGYSSS